MAYPGYRAQNHPQQVAKRGAMRSVDDRRTPDDLWVPLHRRYDFTIDAAATAENTKTPRFCNDGLSESWSGERVWCNPPYSDLRSWVAKAHEEMARGCCLVVMLLPATRCEQPWWQDLVEPYRDRGAGLRTRFVQGRTRFIVPGKKTNGRPPFGCVLLIWDRAVDGFATHHK